MHNPGAVSDLLMAFICIDTAANIVTVVKYRMQLKMLQQKLCSLLKRFL